ncbi:BglI family type II restriction endonuclease [Alkalimonas mucilaginosa]|uniref:BglI family type II restriction endonuclease n=1 Tax=Alkalimonas mucilaginosa TaxID=3057676 RepID=A0ABU7JK67_9GAMM|nr:BglI family type II restriction endonuclease [Alkalimonas sp. MEB004]MEE2026096.1 BglI family type II restriction endonuclease [Alkalimonas sp. MEB004]
MDTIKEYMDARDLLIADGGVSLIELEEQTTHTLSKLLLNNAVKIKQDFDKTSDLNSYWERYAPIQRGHKPRGEAFPWGEVGEKVIEGYLYSQIASYFDDVRFVGAPYGHDIRFTCRNAFIHIDAKSTGPNDNPNEVVSSPNQVTGNGMIEEGSKLVYNDLVNMTGPKMTRQFRPELPPFYIIDGKVLPTLTFYIKIVYEVHSLGQQPLKCLELISVPNGLILFDGPNLSQRIPGLLTPGKDEVHVERKRTRIKLDPLAKFQSWRCQKIDYSSDGQPVLKPRM